MSITSEASRNYVAPFGQPRRARPGPLGRSGGNCSQPSLVRGQRGLWQLLADSFEEAAAHLIQRARAKDQRVGARWHLDASEAETHAAPQHDCTSYDDCPTAKTGRRNPRMQRVGTATAKATRQLLAAMPVEDGAAAVSVEGLRVIPIGASVVDHERNGRRFTSGGHWWFTRDMDAGVRAYSRGSRGSRRGTAFSTWR
ncbi:MAG: hypothetical protein ACYDEA_00680 [Candidatus Dormibacteria bacterium]